MPRRDQLYLLGLAVLSVLFAVGPSTAGLNPDVLLAVPALLLVLPLLVGRYVGEDGIARLTARFAAQRPRTCGVAPGPVRTARILPRGGN